MAYNIFIFLTVFASLAPVVSAQATNELFVPPSQDGRFIQNGQPRLPYGATIGGSLRPLEGGGLVIGFPRAGNSEFFGVDPVIDSDGARELRDRALGQANSADSGLGDVFTEDFQRYMDLWSRIDNLNSDELREFQDLLRNLSNPNPGPPAWLPWPPDGFSPLPVPEPVVTRSCPKTEDDALICRFLKPLDTGYRELCECD